jgi:hypothetical protein
MRSKINQCNPKLSLDKFHTGQILGCGPKPRQEIIMHTNNTRPWVRRALVVTGQVLVLVVLAAMLGTAIEHEWSRHQADAQLEENEVRTAEQWRESIQQRIQQITADARAAKQAQGRNDR